ncbi:MAG: fumarylacetoacetate hydrolase family protein [Limisphaerales bacterium]
MSCLRLCRFRSGDSVGVGLLEGDSVRRLSFTGLAEILNADSPSDSVINLAKAAPTLALGDVEILSPADHQEIWAAGVTYLRSKTARMEESDFSASAYDRVYDADRPEIFFKSLAEKTVPNGGPVGIRKDGKWNVPEPELALVTNATGEIVGYTIGNDMSSRDIEGENLLYLPQAKVYQYSCALGPTIVIGPSEEEARQWEIGIKIDRGGEEVFSGQTSISQIKRSFDELAEYLHRSQDFPHGAILLTGTGVVPPDEFTLAVGDRISIHISGIGELVNDVVEV